MFRRCAFLVIFSTGAILAQGTGSITGTVSDPSGAAVAGAAVTATLVERGTTRSVHAGSDGQYVMPLMPIGNYVVTVTHPGFKRYEQKGIELTANENVRVDLKLELGNVTDSVSVTAEAPLVESRSSTMGTLIDSRRVQELPINGRNVVALAAILPGVANISSPQTFTNYNQGPTYNVNGSRANQNRLLFDGMQFNAVFRNTGMNYPPPDALQEVKVLTNNFGAEYGRNSGSIFNVVTRSGTNEIHGAAWEFLRNQNLNARSFFAPSQKPQLIQNQFGATAGGPIRKNKLFLFGSYEGLRVRPASLSTSAFPLTADERAGDFSSTKTAVKDPLTGQPFPNNRIPSAREDKVAAKVLGNNTYMPLPNGPGGQLINTFPQPSGNNNVLVRMDYNRGRHTIDGRYYYNMASNTASAGQVPTYLSLTQTARTQNITLADTFVLTPSLINELRGGFNRLLNLSSPVNNFSLADLGGNFPVIGRPIPPALAINGRVTLGQGSSTAQQGMNQSLSFSESLTWSHGTHTVKGGMEFLRLRFLNRGYANTMGSLAFTGALTGSPAADFYLGQAATVGVGTPNEQDAAQIATYYYVQDDWHVHKRLTLNLGVRYELPLPWVHVHDFYETLSPGQQSKVIPNAPLGMLFPGDPGVPRGIINTDKNNFAPRVGFAWDIFGDGKTSLRGAYGIFYDTVNADVIQEAGQPFVYGFTFNAVSLSDPLRGQPSFPFSGTLKNPLFVGQQTVFYPDKNLTTPYTQHYNVNLQRQAGKDTVVQVGYVGMQARKLILGEPDNIALFRAGATQANIDQRRILQGYGNNTRIVSGANASYNALQVEVTKRYSRNFSLQGAYTFSRSIDQSSGLTDGATIPNPFNLAAERGLSTFHAAHIASASWIWDMPRLNRQPAPLRWTLGGWQLNGLLSLQSGSPVNIILGSDVALSGTTNQRPNVVGDWHLASDRSETEKLAAWFNRTAFATPAAGTLGNAGRDIVIGPGSSDLNLGLFKNFSLARYEKVRLQFRSEFFDIFNHPNWGNPNANVNAGVNMGRITAAGGARVIQFALKLRY